MIAIMSSHLAPLFAPSPVRALARGEALFRAGDPVSSVFFVRSGTVDLVRHTRSGTRMILHRASGGTVVAEASVWSDTYHCDAVAGDASAVATMPRDAFRARLERDAALASAWAADLARIVQDTRMRAEIRTLRTVSERLDAWLLRGRSLPGRGHIQNLAEEIGVTREALYRELARRDRDAAEPPVR
jgi:CRP-like cAMP-binding protein